MNISLDWKQSAICGGELSASSRSAFTLVEVLIATIIFSLVLAAMNVTFYSAMHLEANTSSRVETMIPLNRASSVLKKDIKGIMMTGGLLAGPVVGLAPGSGSSQSGELQFYTTTGRLDARHPWSEVQKVSYYLAEPSNSLLAAKAPALPAVGEGRNLVRAVTRNLLSPAVSDLQEQPLLREVTSLNFEFFDGVEWLTAWDSLLQAEPVPQAIKVRIEFAVPEAGQPPRLPLELVVPVGSPGFTNGVAGTTNSAAGGDDE